MWDNLSIFFGGDEPLLQEVKEACTLVPYRSGARIFGEGDTGDSVYCVLDGEARAVRYSQDGTEVWLDNFTTGSLFGEMASLVNDARTADMYALTDMQVAVISGKAFVHLIHKHGELGFKVCQLLAGRIQHTTRRVFEQATLTAAARVYAELLRLAEAGGGTKAPVIRNMVTISALATKLNIARETVSRTVSKLKDEAIIQTDGQDLLILKPEELVNRLNR